MPMMKGMQITRPNGPFELVGLVERKRDRLRGRDGIQRARDVRPRVETFELDQAELDFEKMMSNSVRFRAVLVP